MIGCSELLAKAIFSENRDEPIKTMENVKDKYQVSAEPQIGFGCGKCGEWNNSEDTLELNGEHVDGVHVESDRIECTHCNAENFVYR